MKMDSFQRFLQSTIFKVQGTKVQVQVQATKVQVQGTKVQVQGTKVQATQYQCILIVLHWESRIGLLYISMHPCLSASPPS